MDIDVTGKNVFRARNRDIQMDTKNEYNKTVKVPVWSVFGDH